eukprot:CAMPEP_0196658826 /NCGR_PEP_ID=MMETSP1086-20130531/31807_1 /TAXON_ID=77921 /ORGANISM="Cyanoptyche  gloeocystis , Strain SAG4.97" /LENGTH=338 /DNA_ID=CAMNT_0041992575 /DNA_START=64 /DNA_END=1077 /DNA_ORIENTATION=+
MSEVVNCRFYEQQYPEIDDLVMVQVKRIAEMGAYVSLLEYNNIEGMILLSELSRRRIRSISKLIRVGRTEVVVVLRVDKEKGYIDLSKRRVAQEDVPACEDRFNKAKAVHSILRHIAETQHEDLEGLYQRIGWPLYRKYGHAYDAFKVAITDPEAVFSEFNLPAGLIDALVKNIRRRLTPQPLKIRADIEATCFEYEGIDAIKAALLAGQNASTEETPIKIKLVAPPLYVMLTTSLDKDKGIAALSNAIEIVKTQLHERKGALTVKEAPRAVTEADDRKLDTLLEELERKRQEKDGDGQDEDEEGITADIDEGLLTTDVLKSKEKEEKKENDEEEEGD